MAANAENAGIQAELNRLLEILVGVVERGAAGEKEAGGKTTGGAGMEEAVTHAAAMRGDAIDQVLAERPRASGVVSLREAPEVNAFRDELVDGLIRVDTANQLLRLVNEVIVRMLRQG